MPDSVRLGQLKSLLAPFLARNPYSKISEIREDEEGNAPLYVVERPWNDETLLIRLPEEQTSNIAACLNSLLLPPRFSALWHADTKDFEVIWTAFKLSALAEDLSPKKIPV
jgi:hypothetical protein